MLKIVRSAAVEKAEMEKMQKMLEETKTLSKKDVPDFVKKHPILETVFYTRNVATVAEAYQSLVKYGYDDGGVTEMGLVTKTFAELDKILKGGL